MKIYLLILVMLASSFQELACAIYKNDEQHLDSANLLQNYFQDNINIRIDDKVVIEYCPDNTCDVMEIDGRRNKNILADFAYLYLFFGSKYIYLLEWKAKENTKQHVSLLLKKYDSGECTKFVNNTKPHCILNTLSRRYGIKVFFVRYDEGVRSVVPVKL